MNKKNEFLTIGELSNVTGVNKKSLIYYEKLGLLTPIYVNPETRYRYYSLSQFHIVEAIQICVELNIPLKSLKNFINSDQTMNFTALFDYGEKLAEKKIKAIRKGLDYIHQAQEEMERIKKYKATKDTYIRNIPEKLCYVSPYDPKLGNRAYYTEMTKLYEKLENDGFEPFYEQGILYEYLPNEIKRYIFIEIMPTTDVHENIKRIPSGNYLCKFVPDYQIEKTPELFPELFTEGKYVLAIEVEVFDDTPQEYNLINELQIFLDGEKIIWE